MTAPDSPLHPSGPLPDRLDTPTCAHCERPATKKWRLLGGDEPMGFGHRDVCDEHHEAERTYRSKVLREALGAMRHAR